MRLSTSTSINPHTSARLDKIRWRDTQNIWVQSVPRIRVKKRFTGGPIHFVLWTIRSRFVPRRVAHEQDEQYNSAGPSINGWSVIRRTLLRNLSQTTPVKQQPLERRKEDFRRRLLTFVLCRCVGRGLLIQNLRFLGFRRHPKADFQVLCLRYQNTSRKRVIPRCATPLL